MTDRLPSLRRLQGMLRVVTEFMVRECASPNSVAPEWDPPLWVIAQAVAAMHGISSLLSQRLAFKGPAAWCSFLDQQRAHTANRHRTIIALLAQIDQLARDRQLPVVALKGAALHELGTYEPGQRPMADVDLLVHPRDYAAMVELIRSLNYHSVYRSRREHTFAPALTTIHHSFGEHSANPVKIELHTRIAERLPVRLIDITGSLLPAAGDSGLQSYRCTDLLMTHLLLHAAGNMRAHALRFVQLHDIAELSSRLDAEQWWHVLRDARGIPAWWVFASLRLTGRYYPDAVPLWVLRAAARSCPAALRHVASRHLLSVGSLSRLRMTFFAGFEWCRSMQDGVLFVRERVLPARESCTESDDYAVQHAWASGDPWGLSACACFSMDALKTSRAATLHSVRAAYRAGPGGEA